MSRTYRKYGHFVSFDSRDFVFCGFLIVHTLDKEVLGYYDDGMRVPDDITLLWSDDKSVAGFFSVRFSQLIHVTLFSWGNMVRLPIPSEFNRTGGAGVYYHVRISLASAGQKSI